MLLAETAAMARKFSGTSSVAIVRMPRLVVGSFQRCSVYKPMPKRIAVTVVKIKKLQNRDLRDLCPQAHDERSRTTDDQQTADDLAPTNVALFHEGVEHF